jgi:hypothetical protein
VPCCVQFALRKLRGEHDAINVCLAGTVSAGFLGATCEQQGTGVGAGAGAGAGAGVGVGGAHSAGMAA